MPIALDPNRTADYVLASDRAAEQPTTFKLRSLTARERAEVADAFYSADLDGKLAYTPHRAKLLAARFGLAGWENFRQENGNAFHPTMNGDGRATNTNEAIDRLVLAHVVEIGNEVLRMARLSEDEAGN